MTIESMLANLCHQNGVTVPAATCHLDNSFLAEQTVAMRLAILLLLLLLAGCTGEAKLLTQTRQTGRSLEVKVDVHPGTKGTLQFKGNPAFKTA